MATWTAGDHIVTVSATMSVPELIAIARTVHEISSQEWEGMANAGGSAQWRQQLRHVRTNAAGAGFVRHRCRKANHGPSRCRPRLPDPGTALVGVGPEWTRHDSERQGGDQHTRQRPAYVCTCRSPRAIAPTAQLQISRVGLDPVLVPFIDANPDVDRTFATYVFSEPTPYTAQIIGADGAVLASWPPP